ncbi:putative WRKY transcription factor 35 [Hordeum vulgare]|nr:putative WRKY transcription factor 35 [Hordeum vulgare]
MTLSPFDTDHPAEIEVIRPEKMELQRRTLEEIAERRRDRDEGGVIVLPNSDEEVAAPIKPIHSDDSRQGSSKDGSKDGPPSDDDGGVDYKVLYNLLIINQA